MAGREIVVAESNDVAVAGKNLLVVGTVEGTYRGTAAVVVHMIDEGGNHVRFSRMALAGMDLKDSWSNTAPIEEKLGPGQSHGDQFAYAAGMPPWVLLPSVLRMGEEGKTLLVACFRSRSSRVQSFVPNLRLCWHVLGSVLPLRHGKAAHGAYAARRRKAVVGCFYRHLWKCLQL